MDIVLTIEFGHDTTILKMEIYDYIDIEPALVYTGCCEKFNSKLLQVVERAQFFMTGMKNDFVCLRSNLQYFLWARFANANLPNWYKKVG